MSTESGANKDAGRQSTDPKIVLQVKENSDSGLSSPASIHSPASSIDKNYKESAPTPLDSAPPRSHKTQRRPDPSLSQQLSVSEYHDIQVENNPQVYRLDKITYDNDNITYADLDPKFLQKKDFMIPENKVLPSKTRKTSTPASSSDSRSTYAEISVSRSRLV